MLLEPHVFNVLGSCLQQLTGQRATSEHAASLLDKRFNTPEPRREPTVLLVDEVGEGGGRVGEGGGQVGEGGGRVGEGGGEVGEGVGGQTP